MGLRMALGSGERDLMELILGRTAVLAGLGLGLGAMGVYLSRSLIQGYLYGIGPLDPITLTGGMVALFLVAILAAWAPARRACKVDFVETLRRG